MRSSTAASCILGEFLIIPTNSCYSKFVSNRSNFIASRPLTCTMRPPWGNVFLPLPLLSLVLLVSANLRVCINPKINYHLKNYNMVYSADGSLDNTAGKVISLRAWWPRNWGSIPFRDRGMTTYVHLVTRLRMYGVIPPLSHIPSRRRV
jgi:hypothetical protein